MDVRLQALRIVGVTGSAARSYVALADLGPTQARDLAVHLGMSPKRLYPVLHDLEERGMVEVVPSRPRLYQAIPIGRLIADQVELARASALRIEAINVEIPSGNFSTLAVPHEKVACILMPSARAARYRTERLLDACRSNLVVVSGDADRAMNWLRPSLDAVARRGVAVVWCPLPDEATSDAGIGTTLVIADGERFVSVEMGPRGIDGGLYVEHGPTATALQRLALARRGAGTQEKSSADPGPPGVRVTPPWG